MSYEHSEAMTNKAELILIFSFVPYVLATGFVVYSMIFGITFGFLGPTRTTYGIESISDSVSVLLLFSAFVPIIPLCILYQIIYLIIYVFKRFKTCLLRQSTLTSKLLKIVIVAIVVILLICFLTIQF